jgi:hypothetical protein
MSAVPPIVTTKADIVPHNPKGSDETTRPDEMPAAFAELKPPGYWSARLGYFVPVRIVSDEEFTYDLGPSSCPALSLAL